MARSSGGQVLLDTALARRIDGVSTLFHRLWLEATAAREGNPQELEFFTRGDVVAVASVAQPDNPTLNRAIALTPDDLEYVRPLVSWYRRKAIWPWFEVGPGDGADALLDALAAEGAWPVRFVQVAVGTPVSPASAEDAEGIAVEPVDGDSVAVFAETLLGGHGLEDEELKAAAADLDRWHQIPGLFPLLIRAEGVPAGAALLLVRDDVALLADAATLVEHRGRGVGAAGLAARIRLAADLGCEVVAGICDFGSTTHVEYQHAGLTAGYTRAVLHLGG